MRDTYLRDRNEGHVPFLEKVRVPLSCVPLSTCPLVVCPLVVVSPCRAYRRSTGRRGRPTAADRRPAKAAPPSARPFRSPARIASRSSSPRPVERKARQSVTHSLPPPTPRIPSP